MYYQLLNPFGKKITDTPERDYYFVTLSEKHFKGERPGQLICQKQRISAKSLTFKSQQQWLQDRNYSDQEEPFKWEPTYLTTVHKKHHADRVITLNFYSRS